MLDLRTEGLQRKQTELNLHIALARSRGRANTSAKINYRTPSFPFIVSANVRTVNTEQKSICSLNEFLQAVRARTIMSWLKVRAIFRSISPP